MLNCWVTPVVLLSNLELYFLQSVCCLDPQCISCNQRGIVSACTFFLVYWTDDVLINYSESTYVFVLNQFSSLNWKIYRFRVLKQSFQYLRLQMKKVVLQLSVQYLSVLLQFLKLDQKLLSWLIFLSHLAKQSILKAQRFGICS